jgi:hypothetical protein
MVRRNALLQGYIASLASTIDSLEQGITAMSASSSSLAGKLSQAYGEADQRKQDAAGTKVSDTFKVSFFKQSASG